MITCINNLFLLINLSNLIKLFILIYYGDDMKKEIEKIFADWAFQCIKWTCDIFIMELLDRNRYDSIDNILDKIFYEKKKNSKKDNNEFGKKIFEIMNDEQRQIIIQLLYKMAKINKPYLLENFDDIIQMKDEDNNIIEELNFNIHL